MGKHNFTPQLPSPATVHVLEGETGTTHTLSSQLASCSGKLIKVITPEAVAAGSAVRVDVSGGLVLGEVVGCTGETSQFSVYVEISQVIPSLSDLARLVSAVMGQRPPALAPAEVQDAQEYGDVRPEPILRRSSR